MIRFQRPNWPNPNPSFFLQKDIQNTLRCQCCLTTSTEPSTDLGILHQIVELGSKLTNPTNLFALTGDYWEFIKLPIPLLVAV